MAKKLTHFANGELIKECTISSVEIIMLDAQNLFSKVALARRTVTKRSLEVSAYFEHELDLKMAEMNFFSIAANETCDTKN